MPWMALIPLAISAAGAIAASKGQKAAQPEQTGFNGMPDEVKKVFLQTYLPAVTANAAKPYIPPPMRRVNAPSSPFDSQELYDLQKYSDATGGLFTPKSSPVHNALISQALMSAGGGGGSNENSLDKNTKKLLPNVPMLPSWAQPSSPFKPVNKLLSKWF